MRRFVLTAVSPWLVVAAVGVEQVAAARWWRGEQVRHAVAQQAKAVADFFAPKNVPKLIAAVGVGAAVSYLLVNSLVWEDQSDTSVADRITRLQLRGEARADSVVRFLLPGGDTALGKIVARDHLKYVSVVPHRVYHRWLLPHSPPLDKPLLQVSPVSLRVNIHAVEARLTPLHPDFGKRVAVIVDSSVIGLHDRYSRNDWLWGTEAYVEGQRTRVSLLYGRVFAVFDDGYYGVLVSQLQDNDRGEFFSIEKDTIVFCTRANLYFEAQEQKTLDRSRSMRYRSEW